jgi:glycosyltransferase involved in cell wall biosynthesis
VLSDFQKKMILKSDLGSIPIEIIPNSISVKKQISFEELDLKTKVNIGFVGRLTKEKGFEDFIEMARKMPHYSFCVAGDFSKLDPKMKYPANLHFEGVLTHDELSDFYQKCRVILFLSLWYEGFPMVLLEAMHYYTPLIVTNLGVMPEVIQHNINGYVVKPGDLDSIQKHVEMIFEDDSQYIEFIKNGKKRAEEFYSTERYYERLMLAISD